MEGQLRIPQMYQSTWSEGQEPGVGISQLEGQVRTEG